MSDSLRPHGLQHAKLSCPSISPGGCFKLMSIESVMLSNHLILCLPLLLPPSVFPSIRVFSNELALCIRQSIGASASASVLAMNIQGWFPLGLTVLIFLLSRGHVLMLNFKHQKINYLQERIAFSINYECEKCIGYFLDSHSKFCIKYLLILLSFLIGVPVEKEKMSLLHTL